MKLPRLTSADIVLFVVAISGICFAIWFIDLVPPQYFR